MRRAASLLLRFDQQFLHGCIRRRSPRITDPFEPDYAFGVEQVIGGRAAGAPFLGDGAARPRSPVEFLLFYPKERERFILQTAAGRVSLQT